MPGRTPPPVDDDDWVDDDDLLDDADLDVEPEVDDDGVELDLLDDDLLDDPLDDEEPWPDAAEDDDDVTGWDDEEPDTSDDLDDQDVEARPGAPRLAIVSWATPVWLPGLQIEIPAVLDPTRARTVWTVTTPPRRERVPLQLRLHGQVIEAEVMLEIGEEPGLRIGRDVLSGRFLVRS